MYIPHIAMSLQYVIDMHCYQSISLVQDMVKVDVMKLQNIYIMYLTLYSPHLFLYILNFFCSWLLLN